MVNILRPYCLASAVFAISLQGGSCRANDVTRPSDAEFLKLSMEGRHHVFSGLSVADQLELNCVAFQRLHPRDLGLVELLAARRATQELLDALSEERRPSCATSIRYVLGWMQQRGYVDEVDEPRVREALRDAGMRP